MSRGVAPEPAMSGSSGEALPADERTVPEPAAEPAAKPAPEPTPEPATEHISKRRFALQMQQPLPRSTVFDRLAFLVGTVAAGWLAVIISIQSVRSPWALFLFIPVWAITAYLVLPRLHKMLSDLYV
ncbi:MAG: hypothetical protein KA158_09950, partial [Leucobacter sp.]|nr:hypothetical protein [Leucobacter sp.]